MFYYKQENLFIMNKRIKYNHCNRFEIQSILSRMLDKMDNNSIILNNISKDYGILYISHQKNDGDEEFFIKLIPYKHNFTRIKDTVINGQEYKIITSDTLKFNLNIRFKHKLNEIWLTTYICPINLILSLQSNNIKIIDDKIFSYIRLIQENTIKDYDNRFNRLINEIKLCIKQ